jgi:hypothetical protein
MNAGDSSFRDWSRVGRVYLGALLMGPQRRPNAATNADTDAGLRGVVDRDLTKPAHGEGGELLVNLHASALSACCQSSAVRAFRGGRQRGAANVDAVVADDQLGHQDDLVRPPPRPQLDDEQGAKAAGSSRATW